MVILTGWECELHTYLVATRLSIGLRDSFSAKHGGPQSVPLHHPATRRLLAGWGYRYNVGHLRRFPAAKRNAIVIFLVMFPVPVHALAVGS